MSRMDRYNETSSSNHASRIDRNKNLYQDFSMNAIYTNITDVTNANAYEIDNNPNSYKTREAYQHLKEYQDIELPREKKELNDVKYLSGRQENKIYDINSVLENARKNRSESDELDEKRKLKNRAYNILSGKNREELEKYREERKKRLLTPEEEEIRELIDTIASKTLAGEIDKATSVDLLSDLMATSVLDKVDASGEIETVTITQEIDTDDEEEIEKTLEESNKILETAEIKDLMLNGKQETPKQEENNSDIKQKIDIVKDPDFYTRSMDLSDKDFDVSDDFKEDKVPLPLKILIFLLVIIIVGIVAYIIHQKFM